MQPVREFLDNTRQHAQVVKAIHIKGNTSEKIFKNEDLKKISKMIFESYVQFFNSFSTKENYS